MPQGERTGPDPRAIARWAERYARSRTVPFLVQWVFIVLLVAVLGALSQGALSAYRAHRPVLQWVCTLAVGAMTLALMWFSISRWGREQIWRISQWVYGKEGYATYSAGDRSAEARRMRWLTVLGVGLAVYHLVGAVLVGLRQMPLPYLQPYSAGYMVPFLGIMIVFQRLGFWAWLWPALYAVHALAVLAGVNLPFHGTWEFLSIIIPIFGYGLVAMVAGHIYSRYALYRLKQAARAGLEEGGEERGAGTE